MEQVYTSKNIGYEDFYKLSKINAFPLDIYEELIYSFGWELKEWIDFWQNKHYKVFSKKYIPKGVQADWFWGLSLPFLTEIYSHLNSNKGNCLLGISGLPGSGKSTLGFWVNIITRELNWPVKVISLDDFYQPANEIEESLKGNPWNVPRGIPGSHSLDILSDSINRFFEKGELICPLFDKSLRNGKGDRSGFHKSSPTVVILEGWFIGCIVDNNKNKEIHNLDNNLNLTQEERAYRKKIENNLLAYLPIWKKINRLWHIKAERFEFTSLWKKEQENNLLKNRGASLKGDQLDNFIRMINVAIPQEYLNNINSDIVAMIDLKRRVRSISKK